jgi:hypothetical protein
VTHPGSVIFLAVIAFLATAAGEAGDAIDPAAGPDVSVAVFDDGIPENPALHRDLEVFPRIRRVEALFHPFMVLDALTRSGGWGALRIVPDPDVAAELLITGKILHSDGQSLTLHIRAVDATGRVWLEQAFSGDVTDDYVDREAENAHEPSYRALFDAIAAGLNDVRHTLTEREMQAISEVSLLRYAQQVAPRAFEDFLTTGADGAVTIHRLPARNDPMIERVALVRNTEYVITDTVDAKFRELHGEIASVYDVWRRYRRKVLEYEQEDLRRAQDTASKGERGSYETVRNAYDNYKYHRITEQEQDKLAIAFENEIGPTVESIEARVEELQAWIEDKYAEWRRILEELHEVETALE